jgi:5'-nucleotidase
MQKNTLKILITNDDGIHGPGLGVLEAIARQISEDVLIVAPETDQSGVSHSLSLSDPLRLREISPRHFAVKGTPTDCVILGVKHILAGEKPDLVLSGVNRGQNVAEDVTYSGTIAAAMEGTLLGIPSIALSQAYDYRKSGPFDWSSAKMHGAAVVRRILAAGIPEGIVINVNFPACDGAAVAGVAVAVQGRRQLASMGIDRRVDQRGNPYFWLAFSREAFEPHEGTDLSALSQNRISITPLKLDLTDLPTLTDLAEKLGD